MGELIIGFIIGFCACASVVINVDKMPSEPPMANHCAKYGAELNSYDLGIFNCTNGATFDRSIVKEKKV